MSNVSVRLVGHDKLMRNIGKMKNAGKLFDNDFRLTAIGATRDFGENTSKMTGNTARGWQTPKRIGLSSYEVSNNIKTGDGKHLIVELLDKGRGEVRPTRAKRLYIPLSEKGRSKKAGQKIPSSFVFGVDYVLAKKSKAVKGLNFIGPIIKSSSKSLTKKIVNTIRRVHSGK